MNDDRTAFSETDTSSEDELGLAYYEEVLGLAYYEDIDQPVIDSQMDEDPPPPPKGG